MAKYFILAIFASLHALSSAGEDGTCQAGHSCVVEHSLMQRGAAARHSSQKLGESSQQPANGTRHPAAYKVDEVPPYTFSAAQREAGNKLLRAAGGDVATEAMYAMDRLFRYWSNTMQNLSSEMPDLEKMNGYFTDLCSALQAAGGQACTGNPLEIQLAFGAARCMLEKDVNAGLAEPAALALFIESEDQIEEIVMRDFFEYFQQNPKGAPPTHCDGEEAVTAAPDQALAGTRQSKALAAASLTRQAADGMLEHFEEVASSASAFADAEKLSRIWQGACKTLGCDAHAWLDIVDAIHGHANELVQVAAPASVVRGHIVSARAAQRAFQRGVNLAMERANTQQANNSLFALQAFMLNKGQSTGTEHYEDTIKTAGGVFDAAIAQLRGSKTPITRWWWCVQVTAGDVDGYFLAFSGPYSLQLAITLSVSLPSAENEVKKLLSGSTPCWSGRVELSATVVAGLGGGGCTVGLSFSVTLDVSGCGASLQIALGASGGCVWGATGCIVGPWLGPFQCVNGAAIGVSIWCCTIDFVRPANSDCW